MHPDPPGPTMIPIVLYLTSILRQIAINLDRDPSLRAISTQSHLDSTDSDVQAISYVERTGNTLREAFNKIVRISRPNQAPTPTSLSAALYQIMNSCMRIYLRASKLAISDSLLQHIDRNSPPLSFYPVSQRVTYLYYLGVFYFNSNQYYRALQCLQSSYNEVSKSQAYISQRRLILIHLVASSLCLGRLPARILLIDPAAHTISKSFVMLSAIIKSGHIGLFHTMTDSSLPEPQNEIAAWLLSKKILFQLKSRCEILVWRSLILKSFKFAGFLGSSEASKKSSMPYVRLHAIHLAARFSYEVARKVVWQQSHQSVDLWPKADEYVDPDFADYNDTTGNDGYASSDISAISDDDETSHGTSSSGSMKSHPALHDPTAEEINSIVLSLISQGFLRGFVAHDKDLLQSRFAIRGVSSSQGSWQQVGFPSIYETISERESDDVPAWITEEKVREKTQVSGGGGGGKVVNLSGSNMKTFGS